MHILMVSSFISIKVQTFRIEMWTVKRKAIYPFIGVNWIYIEKEMDG